MQHLVGRARGQEPNTRAGAHAKARSKHISQSASQLRSAASARGRRILGDLYARTPVRVSEVPGGANNFVWRIGCCRSCKLGLTTASRQDT
eukprot:1090561-Prymnesium_polylepis.2